VEPPSHGEHFTLPFVVSSSFLDSSPLMGLMTQISRRIKVKIFDGLVG